MKDLWFQFASVFWIDIETTWKQTDLFQNERKQTKNIDSSQIEETEEFVGNKEIRSDLNLCDINLKL